MKRLLAALCVAALPVAAASLTHAERDALLVQLDHSATVFAASLQGLSQAQWKYKPAPDRWSIAECAEHVVIANDMMFALVVQQLVKIPLPEKPPQRVGDETVLKGGVDRSKKVQTAPFLEPKGKYASPAEVMAAFQTSRAKVIEYVKTTQDDLRAHGLQTQDGFHDAYQFLLALSAHAERHSEQIAEVKADPRYPKK